VLQFFSLGPFDSAKFEALTEGLSAAVISSAELVQDNPRLRLDAAFFDPAVLRVINSIRAVDGERLSDRCGKILKGRTVGYYADGEIKVVRSGDISRGLIDKDLLRTSSEERFFPLMNGDVLVSSIGDGSIGKVHLFESGNQYATVSEVTVIRQNVVPPAYLAAFLHGRFGQLQIQRQTTGATGQLHLYPEDLGRIYVPFGFKVLENRIADTFRAGMAFRDRSRLFDIEAESLLLDALMLRNWKAPDPLSFKSSYSHAFASGRLDANYFAPKYEALSKIIAATGSAKRLGDGLTTLVSRGSQPLYQDVGLPVINSRHVRANRALVSGDNRQAAPTKLLIQHGDVLVNGTGVGTIGRAAPYLENQDALPDNHVTIVRPSEINPLYLSVYLNSQLGQLQIERMISGSSGQIELYPEDIRQIVVWDAPEQLQLQIADAVRCSFTMESRASELLAAAKRAVEIAIEDSETAALDFIAEQDVIDA